MKRHDNFRETNANPAMLWPETLRAHATTYGVAVERVERAGRLHGNQARRAMVPVVGHPGVYEARGTRRRKRQIVACWKAERRAGESFKAWERRRTEGVAA